jgi:hypothetical protein
MSGLLEDASMLWQDNVKFTLLVPHTFAYILHCHLYHSVGRGVVL